jgi:cation diffusion facilitator family transporter
LSPQRRTALASVVAAALLVTLKLGTGLATGSLGLVSEAIHSGVDLVAAVLTFAAVSVAGRPADAGHPYGHGKAEHLAALAEATILAAASLAIAALAVARLLGIAEADVDPAAYAFVVIGLVIVIDVGRTVASLRGARRYGSPALLANAAHFGSDVAGSVAVLLGLAFAASGYPNADSLAALLVAGLVMAAAARLIGRNVAVLMDRDPDDAHEAARSAIDALEPSVSLRRLRLRQAAGRHFADVVIGVPPAAAIGQGHAAADAVEAAVRSVLPGSDVVVHVEPLGEESAVRERVHAAALGVPRVREVHNVTVLDVDGRSEISLHLKLPGNLPLDEAHEVATDVERAIAAAVPGVDDVRTHVEPLTEAGSGEPPRGADVEGDAAAVRRIVREETGAEPRELRFLRTGDGLVAFLTLGLPGDTRLADAHTRASDVEERIRRERTHVADVIVHTEP